MQTFEKTFDGKVNLEMTRRLHRDLTIPTQLDFDIFRVEIMSWYRRVGIGLFKVNIGNNYILFDINSLQNIYQHLVLGTLYG